MIYRLGLTVMVKMVARRLPIVIACAAIAGCAMPRSVSSLSEVQAASGEGRISLVEVTGASIPPAGTTRATFPDQFLDAADFDFDRLGPGDVLKVRIWEGGTPTVLTSNGDLGELAVDEQGRLYLPLVGTMQVAGMTIPQVRINVIRKLRTVVRNPQVEIRAGERRSMLVSVQGNAARAGTYQIDRGRTRLGALLGETAPDQRNPEMLEVSVRRDGASGTVRLADIYRNPALDIALRPGDTVVLNEVFENVTVLGAAGIQGQVRVTKRDFSITDIIGSARGLNDDAADPRAVFLIRPQPLGGTPLVYQFDMRRPETVALASRFAVHDKDAVLISNAPFAQTRKILSAFSQTLGTLRSATTVVP